MRTDYDDLSDLEALSTPRLCEVELAMMKLRADAQAYGAPRQVIDSWTRELDKVRLVLARRQQTLFEF